MKHDQEQFQHERNEITEDYALPRSYIKKKLVQWCIRVILSIVLYILFWEYTWVKWILVIHIPLSAFLLYQLLTINKRLEKRMNQVKTKLDQ